MFYILLSILSFFLGTDAIKFRCDYVFNSTSYAWFKYHDIPVVWSAARLKCALEGAILASPTTPSILMVMTSGIGTIPVFTGLHSTFSEGDYITVDGIPLEKINHRWGPFEPDNHQNTESCLALHHEGYLLDVNCNIPRPYICYRRKFEEINICGTPDSEYRLDVRTNKCYKFHRTPRHFTRAQFACAAEGGHLAIINSDQEATVLKDVFAKNLPDQMIGKFLKTTAFIGFHNWGEEGEWRTIHGQTLEEAGYAKWAPGEPNNETPGQQCGAIFRTALLDDLWCERPFAFICEKSPDYPPVCDNTDNMRL